MPNDANPPTEELEVLKVRFAKLAEDKSYFQLILRLMELLNPLPGLENMLRGMLFNIVECIGGTNIKLYYWVGETLHYLDFMGESKCLTAIDDEAVARVAQTHVFEEQRGGAEDALLMHGMLRGSWSWTFPLLVGDQLIGVIKLENLHIHGASLGRYLPIFFSHAALILSNEIRNVDLRVATERLRLATEAGIIGIWDWDIPRNELVWDAAMYRLYGRREGDFGGAYEAWISAVHPDDKAYADAEIQAALRGEREYAPEFRVVWPDGSVHHIKAASRTTRDASGQPLRMIGINYDLTERKHAEEAQRRLNRELRAISNCNQALMRADDEQTLLEDICRLICDEAGYRMAWVGYAEQDADKSVRPVAWAGVEAGYLGNANIAWADTERGTGPSGAAIRNGKSVCVQDFATEPSVVPWRDSALQLGYRSSIALPLRDEAAAIFGVLCIYSDVAGAFNPDEIRLMEELAGDLAFGITVLRGRVELKAAERENQRHLRFLEGMDRINRAIQGANDLNRMMVDTLDVVLSMLDCDRAFLQYPCDPEASSWRVPMERNKPEYPGLMVLGHEVPMDPEAAESFRLLLAADRPLTFGPGSEHPLPADVSERHGFKCFMSMAIRPKFGKAWQFGVHQCSHVRQWTVEEQRLLEEVGRRLGDALTTLLMNADLRENERRLAEAERIARIGYLDRDLAAGRVSLSDQVLQITGLSPDRSTWALADWQAQWQRMLHPDDRGPVLAAYEAALAGTGDYDAEYRMLRADGNIVWVHSRADVFRDEAGRAVRVLGTMQDITERKRAEQELERHRNHLEELVAVRTQELALARDAAESANRMKSTFLANMSHELRTPLNAILGFAQIMARDARIPEDQQANLQTINRSGHHLLTLINDVLEISRIEAGGQRLQPATCDVLELVTSLVEFVELRARGKGLDVRVAVAPDLPRHVRIDAGKLRQVLLNLLSNAVKYTEKGEIELAASAVAVDGRSALSFSVRDTGVGIAAEDLERIFQPFIQTDYGAHLGEGTGLGLAISREYAALLGGTLTAESTADVGSCFRLVVPAETTAASDQSTAAHGLVIGLAPGQREYRVLVVEDDADSRYILEEMLRQADFQVRSAENGELAVTCFLSWHPDFIWMDMRMPVMDGYEATRRIRELPGGRDVKIVALTASAFLEDRGKIVGAGCDDVLVKPLNEDELFGAMERLLGLRYRYADKSGVAEATTTIDLVALPASLREELRRAAHELDVEATKHAIERIRAIDGPLAARLDELALAYRYDQIVALCDSP